MKPSVYKLGRFLLWSATDEKQAANAWPAEADTVKSADRPSSFFRKISSDYLLAVDSTTNVSCDQQSLRRFLAIARDTGAGMIYSDFLRRDGDGISAHPLNDYQDGSIRDDFSLGHFFIISAAALKTVLQKYSMPPHDASTALYDLRLKISIDHALIHVPEFLYTVSAKKMNPAKSSGRQTEAQFAYVAKENFVRQQKMEKIATNYLKQIGAYLPARTKRTDKEPEAFQWKASIVIPVLNRKKIITDALTSALGQQTDFPFNILVVDNHSTDGTTNILKRFAAKYPHIQHIIPSSRDLGIGGCWNEAIYSPHCGRYAIQLDSDDLYSSPQTLQKIVNTLRQGQYAMVVGSYTLVNERLKKILPGLIDHREWTPKNGHNNFLRVNGMGAPRAFDTSVIRQFGFPNVSYGEDYAVALRISREYRIGRIYESLYLCRRWSDNTDAGLSVEKQNRNDDYKDKLRTLEIQARQLMNCRERSRPPVRGARSVPTDDADQNNQTFAAYPGKNSITLAKLCHNLYESQKKSWPALAEACRNLESIRTRQLSCGRYDVTLQFNPVRALSSGAAVDAESIKKRSCFLCRGNLPQGQHGILYRNRHMILCNPAPIFDRHFTVVTLKHQPQDIMASLSWLLQLATDASPDYTVLYNGPACGASAPDHLHFQMIPSDTLPFLKELNELPPVKVGAPVQIYAGKGFDRAVVVLAAEDTEALKEQFVHLLKSAQEVFTINDEPPVNVFCDHDKGCLRLTVFLRRKHRPDAYYAESEDRIFISPGAVDMAGVIITPRLKDYERLDCSTVQNIYREVSLNEETLDKIIKAIITAY
jgi:glycosyltransferase involved in cell wall biosynthesis/ATP adenylyltransferase/5',5'''-P-1,P-4-tetraphosphate phosphorylase II